MPRYTYPEPTIQELIERIEVLEGKLGLETAAVGFREAEQGIPSGVQTKIKLDKAVTDPGKHLDLVNGHYVVPEEGFYEIDGNLLLTAPAGEYITAIAIFINGAKAIGGTFLGVKWAPAPEGVVTGVVSGIIFLKKNDHVELFVYQTSGVERKTTAGGENWNRLSISRVDVTSGKEGKPGEKGEKGASGTTVVGGVIKFKWAVKSIVSEAVKIKPGFIVKSLAFGNPQFAGGILVVVCSNMGEVEKGETEEPILLMHANIELVEGTEFRGSWMAMP